MKMNLLWILACLPVFSVALVAQTNDPVLFTVDNVPVRVSEFSYIYSKTNQDKADYSEASLREYLDLYIKFKLKVTRARDMQLDTVDALRKELEGYRRQLANSYLVDKEVTEKLVEEAYRNMQQDVEVSHIFLNCPMNANAADTLRAYRRITNWQNLLKKGASFEQLAADSSEDQSAKENRGNLGYLTAMLPNGYYALEKAVYNAKPGSVLGPIRSNNGYHLARVGAFRPARGEVEVAQILFRKGKDEAANAHIKARADSVYAALSAGKSTWDESCSRFSDDKTTNTKGGYLGFFGINRYQRNFEDAAFGLVKDGDVSMPIETSIGWHIIKRISRRPIQSLDIMRRPLSERIKRDARSELAKQSMIQRIKKESLYKDFPAVLDRWAAKQVDTVFLTYRWKPDPAQPKDVMMQFGPDHPYTTADFESFCASASRERMRGSGTPMREVIDQLYNSWTDDVAMQFEESQLDKKYPEFKSLMREYEEGILLFDATKQLVWDKANADTLGLQAFYDTQLQGKYMWGERARTSLYTLKTIDLKTVEAVRKMAQTKPAAEVLEKFNKKEETLTVLEKRYEKGKNKDLGDLWTAGAMTDSKIDEGTKTAVFYKIEAIEPPTQKALSESRGYAVADYQDYLEKQWVDELRKLYPVKVDEAVFKGLVKK
jgi:peptidyl-prolyl cis-trans isomerase SurA